MLVVAGDRLLDAQVVEQLIVEYRSTAADMVFLVGAASGSELGHVVRDPDAAVVGIIEHKDVLARGALRRIRHLALAVAPGAEGDELATSAAEIMRVPSRTPAKPSWPSATCGSRARPHPLRSRATKILALAPEECTVFHLGNVRHPTPDPHAGRGRSLAGGQPVGLSGESAGAVHALDRLRPDNAQREEYLSDIVSILAQVHDHRPPALSRARPDRDRSQPGDGLQQPGRSCWRSRTRSGRRRRLSRRSEFG